MLSLDYIGLWIIFMKKIYFRIVEIHVHARPTEERRNEDHPT